MEKVDYRRSFFSFLGGGCSYDSRDTGEKHRKKDDYRENAEHIEQHKERIIEQVIKFHLNHPWVLSKDRLNVIFSTGAVGFQTQNRRFLVPMRWRPVGAGPSRPFLRDCPLDGKIPAWTAISARSAVEISISLSVEQRAPKTSSMSRVETGKLGVWTTKWKIKISPHFYHFLVWRARYRSTQNNPATNPRQKATSGLILNSCFRCKLKKPRV